MSDSLSHGSTCILCLFQTLKTQDCISTSHVVTLIIDQTLTFKEANEMIEWKSLIMSTLQIFSFINELNWKFY